MPNQPASDRQTFARAVYALFLIQCVTVWFESIYRLALIKTSMGPEMVGILFIFLPALVIFVPKKHDRNLAKLAMFVLIAARLAIPFLGVRGNILAAGIGTAAGLTLLCTFFARPDELSRRGVGVGIGIGVLMSIAARAWGSSVDITLHGPGTIIAWILAIGTVLSIGRMRESQEPDPPEAIANFLSATIAMLGFFGNFVIAYLMLSSPAVITAWSGTPYPVCVAIICITWTVAVFWPADRMGPAMLILTNIAFSASLIAGIWLQRVPLPFNPDDPAVIAPPSPWWTHLFFNVALFLSPVLLANVHAIAKRTCARSARAMAIPVTIGGVVFLAIPMLLTFSNVWGYVDVVGPFMRDKFYLPFAIACVLILLPHVLIHYQRDRTPKPFSRTVSGTVAAIVAVIALVGVGVNSLRSPEDSTPEKLTVLTYNMQLGSEEEGDWNLPAQCELLRAIDADIIGLQESDTPRPGGGNVDAARYLADRLDYYVYFGPSTVTGTFGTAILSRYPITNPRTIFTYSTKDEVGTAAIDIEVDGHIVCILNSHPAGRSERMRAAHMDAMIAEALKYDYVIAVGDYNTRPGSPWYDQALGVLDNAWRERYPDGTGPRHPDIGEGLPDTIEMPEPIDHIFISRNFRVDEAYYLPKPQSETDHPAHWAVLSWE